MSRMDKVKRVAFWALRLFFAFVYVAVGRGKFAESKIWATSFRNWGYPDHFYLVIGALEVLGGLALLLPRTLAYGAATLSCIMFGACMTHLVFGPRPNAIFTGVLAVVFALIAWTHRPEWFRARLATVRRQPAE